MVVDTPAAADQRGPTLCSSLQREQRDNVSSISVEYLFVGVICWGPDSLRSMRRLEVFNVRNHPVFAVLQGTEGTDIG